MRQTLVLAGMLALLLSGMRAANAQLNFTLSPDTQTAAPGSTLTFSGTLTNNGSSTLYITSDTPNLIGMGLTLDDTNFFNNVPASLNPGDSTGLIELFDVVIDSTTAFSSYPGSIEVVGGATIGAQDMLASSNFTVIVAPAIPPPPPVNTPEPGSIALMAGLSMTGAGLFARRIGRRAR